MKLMSDLTSMEVMEVERIKVKEDPDWGSSVPKHEPIDELYLDHEVKHDLVLGPELLLREQQPLVSHTFEVTVKIEEAESHEVKIEKYNEDTEADFVGVRATYSDSKLQCRGIDTNAYHWTKKDILSIQNCFVRIERMTLFKEQYTCKICKKIFSQKAILTKHLSSHEEPNNRQKRIRKTATDEVDTAARVRDVSLIKQAVKNTEKPYQCSRCEKNFKLRVLLQNHMRIHTGEKPYVCKTCDRRFTELSNLKRHERVHTGEKPFSCQICKKQFSLKINLRDHINVHTKKRPYVCILCSKDFRDLSTFTRHKLIHSEKKITCDICRKKFTRKYHLKRHMESHNKK